MRNSAALLPTGTRMNPDSPEDAKFYDYGQTAYVVENVDTGARRVLTSFGELGSAWGLATVHSIHHDQTLRNLGWYAVVGVHDFGSGEKAGEVPSKKLAHWVFK